jgi:hypothetical protein
MSQNTDTPVASDVPHKQDQTLIFLHIGKTAGTTLRTILEKQYKISNRVLLESSRWELTLADFPKLPEERRGQPLVYGHLSYGLHEWVPRPVTYITILRDPVHRIVSHYHWVRRGTKHRLHDLVVSRDMSLLEYATEGISPELDNGQTRMIAGDTTTPVGEAGREMLERAKRNIKTHFSAVGFTERFDESVVMMKRVLGWSRIPPYVRRHDSSQSRPRPPTPESVKDAIREHNQLDIQLYEFAQARFDAAIESDPGFAADLAAYQRLLRRYRPWGDLTYNWPRRAYKRASGAKP